MTTSGKIMRGVLTDIDDGTATKVVVAMSGLKLTHGSADDG